MEYSKEDLMEAKKQIWGVGENMGGVRDYSQFGIKWDKTGQYRASTVPRNYQVTTFQPN